MQDSTGYTLRYDLHGASPYYFYTVKKGHWDVGRYYLDGAVSRKILNEKITVAAAGSYDALNAWRSSDPRPEYFDQRMTFSPAPDCRRNSGSNNRNFDPANQHLGNRFSKAVMAASQEELWLTKIAAAILPLTETSPDGESARKQRFTSRSSLEDGKRQYTGSNRYHIQGGGSPAL